MSIVKVISYVSAMSDDSVWASGLLLFYEIFRFLEEAMVRMRGTPVGEYNFEELMRTQAFEKDLEFYLGKDWVNSYSPGESVTKYLIHLQEIEKKTPILLIAYIYHLYMGLLSGGQILNRKRALAKKLFPFGKRSHGGNAVTDFGEHKIFDIKKKVVDTTNQIALTLDPKTKEMLIEESKIVFILNNSMVKTIHRTNVVLLKKFVAFVFAVYFLYYCLSFLLRAVL